MIENAGCPRRCGYSGCLTRESNDVVYSRLDPKRNLTSSTEAQEALQDHGRSAISKDSLSTGSRQWSWEKPASAGFFSSIAGASLLRAAFRRKTSTITRAVWKNAPLLSTAPASRSRSHNGRMRFGCRMVNRLHQIAGMSSVYASPRRLFWIHQLSSRMHSGSRMIDHRPGWP
jgi:hypothetical protein